jgi:hypothetical protein
LNRTALERRNMKILNIQMNLRNQLKGGKEMKRLFSIFFVMTLLLTSYAIAHADSGYMTSFNSRYGTAGTAIATCSVCHTTAPSCNSYGNAFKNNANNYATIEPLDSDGDGFTNIVEINARTFPGNADSKPAATDAVVPKITAFNMPLTSTSLTVPINKFTATDNVKVTGYLVKTTSTKPLATATKWRATKPASYKFAVAGTKTLYAWVKDAAGNISARRTDTVTITLPLTAASQSTTATAATKTHPSAKAVDLIPAPSGQQIFTYEPADVSIASIAPASARPVSVGPIAVGGDTLSIHVSIGQFANTVNIYLTAYAPSDISGGQPLDVLTLSSDNNFEPLSDKLVPWRTGVTGVDETVVSDIPISDLPSGTHMLVLTVTSPDNPDSYYQWVTYFTVQ